MARVRNGSPPSTPSEERAPLADPGLADDHPRQVAHQLLTAVGLGFVFYGTADVQACFQAFATLAPALRTSDGHNGSAFLGALPGRPGIYWLAFQGPNGSAIALCVTQDADIDFVTHHLIARLREARPPWEWNICSSGSVPVRCAHIIDSADGVELHDLPGLHHIPAGVSAQLPAELADGLAQRGWEPAGNGLKTDVALIGGGSQAVFVNPEDVQSFAAMVPLDNTVNGVVPQRFRGLAQAPYTVEAVGDVVAMCQRFAVGEPTASPENIDAAARVLVTLAVAPHTTLGSQPVLGRTEAAAPESVPPPPGPAPTPAAAPPPPPALAAPSYPPAPRTNALARTTGRSPWPKIIGVAAAIAVVVVGVWALVQPSDTRALSHRLGPSSGGLSDTNTGMNAAPRTITFDSMREFVTDYYAQLPAGAPAAWTYLDATYQQRTGFDGYRSFWAGIGSVTVISVSPRDATSVIVRLRYVTAAGQTDTEDRWLSIDVVDGAMRITDSARIGAV